MSTPVTPFNGTQSGTYVSTLGGSQTFTRTITDHAGVRTNDSVFTLPDGDTVSHDATFTKTATGWTRDVTTTLANGRTTTLQETGTKQADGSTALSGTFKYGHRWTEDLSGTETASGGTETSTVTAHNPWGNSRTRTTTATVSDTGTTGNVSTTTYGGASFSNDGALTILQSQSS